jgi:hypothetical protein
LRSPLPTPPVARFALLVFLLHHRPQPLSNRPGLPSSRLICRRVLSPFTPEGVTSAAVRCFLVTRRLQL